MHVRTVILTASFLIACCVSVLCTAQDAESDGGSSSITPAVEPADREDEAPAKFEPPKYRVLRHREDWSDLRWFVGTDLDDPFDPIKYLEVDSDGDVWLSLGGQYRARGEGWTHFGFNGPADRDDAFLLNRFLFHVDLHATEYLRVFAQGKSALSTDRTLPGGRRPSDVDELDLQNGFVDVMVPFGEDAKLTLRPGRQELLFGSQRLVSPLDWSNSRRTFDGISAILDVGPWNVHGFWTQVVPVDKYDFNSADHQSQFWGVYATSTDAILPGTCDAYFLGLDLDVPAAAPGFNGTAGDERRYTVGARLAGKLGDSDFDYDVEGAYQFGELGTGDIDAYMVSGELGYTIADTPEKPRFSLGLDYASGDESVGGDVGTFNQLFPLGHAYLGYIDHIGRQNIVAAKLGFEFEPLEDLTVTADGHYFLRAETKDALYGANGAVIVPDGLGGNSSSVGYEIDVTVSYAFTRHVRAALGYSYFFAGDFVQDSVAGDDSDVGFLWASMAYTF